MNYSSAKEKIQNSMRKFVLQKDFPCIAAIKSIHQNESRVEVFRDFGSGTAGPVLRASLQQFLQDQRRSGSETLTFWAVYEGDSNFSETEFEDRLWRELSALTSEEQRAEDWGPHSADPSSQKFSFCLFGEPFFVVGLHPNAERRGRRFERTALIFNVFRQFESLQKRGAYAPMVRTNRARDVKFDGSVNPMSQEFGEEWEAIQFSGRKNSRSWKCPFKFLHKRSSQ